MRAYPSTAPPPDRSEPSRHVQRAVDLFSTHLTSSDATDIPVAALDHIREAGRLGAQYFGGSRRTWERAAGDEFLFRLQSRFTDEPNNTRIAVALRHAAAQIDYEFSVLH